jgi:hypothetical protein
MKYIQTENGYYYKVCNNNKKVRVSKDVFYKNVMKGGEISHHFTNKMDITIEFLDLIETYLKNNENFEKFKNSIDSKTLEKFILCLEKIVEINKMNKLSEIIDQLGIKLNNKNT